MRTLPLALLALACTEYKLGGRDDPVDGDSDTDTDTLDTAVIPDEDCNGEDDDGDGEVDEGFGDVDGDGTADCIDTGCALEEPAPIEEVDTACGSSAGDPPVNPWDEVIEWHAGPDIVYGTPMVGDLDLDGVPEVVVPWGSTSGYHGEMVVLDGASGTEELSIPDADTTGGAALGDVDGDGYGDIVGFFGNGCGAGQAVAAYDWLGSEIWSVPGVYACESYPAIADIEGDGRVEVIAGSMVIDGPTGTVLATLGSSTTDWGTPAVADMDGDGIQEILLSNRVMNADGTTRFSCGSQNLVAMPHPVQADSDPEGEVIVSAYGLVSVCDDDGTLLWDMPVSIYGTAAAVADFDGDGAQEFAMAWAGNLHLFEMDGTENWSTAVSDYSGLAGCTSWDIDLDGVPEVVYADEQDLLVIDGSDGTVVIREAAHASVTLDETPAVADVDGDGHGELIYGSDLGDPGVTVVGSADGDWPYSPPVYNQFSYYGANVNEDLSIPATPPAPWIYEGNLFRGQPSAVAFAGRPNLHVGIADVCAASCDTGGKVEVMLIVWNDGVREAKAGIPIEVWSNPGGVDTLLLTTTTPNGILSGSSDTLTVETAAHLLGDALVARIDAAGTLAECDDTDNDDVYADLPCVTQ